MPVAEGLQDLAARARLGHRDAWEQLVERLKGVVWRATAGSGLSAADREDVFAATFFRLFEHLGDVRDPDKLPGWLATTARHEIIRLGKANRRLQPTGDLELHEPADPTPVDEALLDGELRAALQCAFLRLGRPCQELLRLASAVPPITYEQMSELTGLARGSVGPTRQRCLERLRQMPELRSFIGGAH